MSSQKGSCDQYFDAFQQASTLTDTLDHFQRLCQELKLHNDHLRPCRHFYNQLKKKLTSWKCTALWNKYDKKMADRAITGAKNTANTHVLIVGAGPVGLRAAIECAMLGCKVVVVEKRNHFSRNNVLHFWPFIISDMKSLGAKTFHGRFCSGSLDHCSIRQVQLILLKIALLLGVNVFINVTFNEMRQPTDKNLVWTADITPADHIINKYQVHALINAEGCRTRLAGFHRKEFRGKLAIAITANFINYQTKEESRVEEISGVAYIFNQGFFNDLRNSKGIDLENIVYYRDNTHYFVMTAKKKSLLLKGVLKADYSDVNKLLSTENIDQIALQNYAKQAADFSTRYQLPKLEFALNHYKKPDVAVFDFTSIYAAEHSCRVIERKGQPLLMQLAGDGLLEPFWPTGSGCARGFLGAYDSAWMIRGWSALISRKRADCIELIRQRESVYTLLAQTTPNNLQKNITKYSLDPNTRYCNLNIKAIPATVVQFLYDDGSDSTDNPSKKMSKSPSMIAGITTHELLGWCSNCTSVYKNINIVNMTTSWKDGMAFCAIIHRFRPDLIDFDSLSPDSVEENLNLAISVSDEHLAIAPTFNPNELIELGGADPLSIMCFVAKLYDVFKNEKPQELATMEDDAKAPVNRSPMGKLRLFRKISSILSRNKSQLASQKDSNQEEPQKSTKKKSHFQNLIKSVIVKNSVATKFRQPVNTRKLSQSQVCYVCGKNSYLLERICVEDMFLHNTCFKCHTCEVTLRIGDYEFVPSDNPTEKGKFYCKLHGPSSSTFTGDSVDTIDSNTVSRAVEEDQATRERMRRKMQRKKATIMQPVLDLVMEDSASGISSSEEEIDSTDDVEEEKTQQTSEAATLENKRRRQLKRKLTMQQIKDRQFAANQLFLAQEIQRKMRETEYRISEITAQGAILEKRLRTAADTTSDEDLAEWFDLIKEKNALQNYEVELSLMAKMVELEDKISVLKSERPRDEEKRQLLNETEAEKEALEQTLQNARDKVSDNKESSIEYMLLFQGFTQFGQDAIQWV